MLLHDLLAAGEADSPAVTFKDVTVGYGALREMVDAFASALAGVGIERGDRVAILLDKRIETVVAILGASAAGAIAVPINPLLRPHQVAHVIDDCAARLLVTSADGHALLGDVLPDLPCVERVVVVGASPDELATLAESDRVWAWEALEDDGEVPDFAAVETDPAAIFYTSGSTGRPKGVVVSHRNLVVGGESVGHYLGNHGGDRILAVLPLSFDAGFSQLTTGFSAGAHVVLVNYLLPRDVVRLCAQHRITGLTCVPPLWVQLAAQDWPTEATAAMRYFANTGGRMPKATLERLRTIFPDAEPYLMYGLTEAFRSTYLDPAEVDRRPDSIGKAIPNAEVLVVRPDGRPCAPGEEGELVHRGPLVTLGYWNDPERTAERFRPAPGRDPSICVPELAVWSGDRVVRDEAGFLYFVGRMDEMIKTSGYRVSPSEIEEVVYDTGLAGDAVALGVDDSALGQRIVLFASPSAGAGTLDEEALLATLRRELPRYMVPSEIRVEAELPRSPNGKLDRTLLRDRVSGK